MGENLAFFSADEIRNFYLQISTNVRKLRENKGISQLDMALSMDIKSQTARVAAMISILTLSIFIKFQKF